MKKQVRKCVVRDYVNRTPKKIIKDTILTTLRNEALKAQENKEKQVKTKEDVAEEKKVIRRPKKTSAQ